MRQAIMTMGLSELKQWVYLLSASNAENQMEATIICITVILRIKLLLES